MNTKLIKSQEIKGVSVTSTGKMHLFKLTKGDIAGRKQLPVLEFEDTNELSKFIELLNEVNDSVLNKSDVEPIAPQEE